jgi:hypothetical protein
VPAIFQAFRCFDEVARRGSVRKAAETLHLTAATVNQQVLNLEASVGVPLFDRLPRGMHLSPKRRCHDEQATLPRKNSRSKWSTRSRSDIMGGRCVRPHRRESAQPIYGSMRTQRRAAERQAQLSRTEELRRLKAELRRAPSPCAPIPPVAGRLHAR